MAETKDIIQLAHIRKSFRTRSGIVEVLKGIDLNIRSGDFVIIFGPSGCGKSTLLHTLLGLEPPSEGTVLMQDNNFYNLTEDQRALFRRRHIGMIYQQPLWISSLTVWENLYFPLKLLNYRDADIGVKAKEVLESIGMSQWAQYTPTELSSGQQQKISLARSLMTDPAIIVADEPTGNLDTVSGHDLLETFSKLSEQGRTIVMVTHDLEYLKYATKLIHMIDGLIVEDVQVSSGLGLHRIASKKEGTGGKEVANVHDPEFLKKLDTHS